MTEERKDVAVTDEELETQDATELPDREAMSLINANVAAPVNAAVAANVGESGSHTHVSSSPRVVHKDGRTVVSERTTEGGDR